MKKILALVLVSAMMVSSTLCVFAQDSTEEVQLEGSRSPASKDDVEKLQQEILDLTKQVRALTNAINASGGNKNSGNSGGGGGRGSSRPSQSAYDTYARNNAVPIYGGGYVGQGGKIEINGGKSNVTFTIKAPTGGVATSASSFAQGLGGSLITCINTSSPGVGFATAKVNFFISGVTYGDNIAVYQLQSGKWVQLPVVEIRTDHVVVNMTRHGDVAFIRVPVLASTTH